MTESHCPRCGVEETLPFGSICRRCQREINRKAARIARWSALLSTAAVGAYAYLQMADDRMARTIGAVSVLLWYVFSYIAVQRAARLLLK